MRSLPIKTLDVAELGELSWPERRTRRLNPDLIGAAIMAVGMWPLIFWLVAFVAEQRGF